jgi:hypothetical protein
VYAHGYALSALSSEVPDVSMCAGGQGFEGEVLWFKLLLRFLLSLLPHSRRLF